MRPSNSKKSRKSIIEKREVLVHEENLELNLSPFDSHQPAMTSAGTFVIQVRKAEQPISGANIVFENIVQLISKLSEVFGDKVINFRL